MAATVAGAAPIEHRFDSAEALVAALSDHIATTLEQAIAERGTASLLVSGGSTPAPLYRALARRPLAWSRVHIGLVDERWVDAEHPDSNEALVRRTLLTGPAAAATWVPMKTPAPDAEAGQAGAEAALRAVARPFDLVLLGMGLDGHTASLFPQSPQLARALDRRRRPLTVAIDPVTAPHARLSLSLRGLLDARQIVLLLTGDAKWQVYRRALDTGPVRAMPVRAVLRQTRTPVAVYHSR